MIAPPARVLAAVVDARWRMLGTCSIIDRAKLYSQTIVLRGRSSAEQKFPNRITCLLETETNCDATWSRSLPHNPATSPRGRRSRPATHYPAQRYHAQRGNWLRVDRGIYRIPEWPVGSREDLVRWSLWSRGRGVVSHETALSVHDLGDVDPSRCHLTVPRNFRQSDPAVVLHRSDLQAVNRLPRA